MEPEYLDWEKVKDDEELLKHIQILYLEYQIVRNENKFNEWLKKNKKYKELKDRTIHREFEPDKIDKFSGYMGALKNIGDVRRLLFVAAIKEGFKPKKHPFIREYWEKFINDDLSDLLKKQHVYVDYLDFHLTFKIKKEEIGERAFVEATADELFIIADKKEEMIEREIKPVNEYYKKAKENYEILSDINILRILEAYDEALENEGVDIFKQSEEVFNEKGVDIFDLIGN